MLSGVWQLFTNDTIPAWLAALLTAIAVLAAGAYFAGFWALEGQTPGMRFVAIRVEHRGAPELGFRRAFRRLWATALAVAPAGIGLLGVLFRDNRRGLHDRISDTDVVKRDNRVLAPWSQNRVPGGPG